MKCGTRKDQFVYSHVTMHLKFTNIFLEFYSNQTGIINAAEVILHVAQQVYYK